MTQGGALAQLDEGALLRLAAQERSVLEIYCTAFAGAPVAPPQGIFLMLGKLVLLDHLEGLGYEQGLADLVVRAPRRLCEVAFAFGVATVPPMSTVKGLQPP